MTNEEIETGCPEWCVHQPHFDHDIHFGDVMSIPLGSMEPERIVHCLTGDPAWRPNVLEVYLQRNPGAQWPTIRIGLSGSDEAGMLKLDPMDALDLLVELTHMLNGIMGHSIPEAMVAAAARAREEVAA